MQTIIQLCWEQIEENSGCEKIIIITKKKTTKKKTIK